MESNLEELTKIMIGLKTVKKRRKLYFEIFKKFIKN